MKSQQLHPWRVTVAQAHDIQRRLAGQVSQKNELGTPRLIAGVDISAEGSSGQARGAAVVLSYPDLDVAEVRVAWGKPGFPYVPGLLSFRESPLILAACEKLSLSPDLVLVDGQGLAHPRRLGLASHLGLLLDIPTIGCAKSRLWGQHEAVGEDAGSTAELVDKGEVIGAVLRTQVGKIPLYVSVGHKIDLSNAIQWVLRCCRNHRLPEPLRLAHLAAGGSLEEGLRQAVPQIEQGRLL
jgi:deoxyribonuclease V